MRVDFSLPIWLVTYYHIIGTISLLFNIGTILLLLFKSSKLDNFRFYLLTFQTICTIVDFHVTFLMHPIPLYPLVGGYCNGFLAVYLDVWSHHLMNFILAGIFCQVECLAFCFIRKHQTIAKILSYHKIPDNFYRLMLFIACLCPVVGVLVFLMAGVPRDQLMEFVALKYPDYYEDFSRSSNFALYDLSNFWLIVTCSMGVLISSILGATYTFVSIDITKMLKESQSQVSAQTFQKHRTAIRSLFAQLATSFIVLAPPSCLAIVIFLELEHSQFIVQILISIFALHSSVNAAVLVITTPPFRQFVFRTPERIFVSLPVSGTRIVMN